MANLGHDVSPLHLSVLRGTKVVNTQNLLEFYPSFASVLTINEIPITQQWGKYSTPGCDTTNSQAAVRILSSDDDLCANLQRLAHDRGKTYTTLSKIKGRQTGNVYDCSIQQTFSSFVLHM